MNITKFNGKLIAFTFLFFTSVSVFSQTLEEGREYISKKNYEKAKDVFEVLIRKYPKRADVNKWYGEALYETGNYEEADKYLTFAAKNRIQTAFLYLGLNCINLYQFDRAIDNFKVYQTYIKNRPEEMMTVNALIADTEIAKSALDRVEEVQIVDSLIVDKNKFFDFFKLSSENGKIVSAKKIKNKAADSNSPVFETQRGDRQLFQVTTKDNRSEIVSRVKLYGDEWSEHTALPVPVNSEWNDGFPYLLSDGMTLYFSSDRKPGMGGYDLYLTKYNAERKTYLNPSRLPMPFNSPFNDYMIAIDEENHTGWFASDRYQHKDSVIIYLFLENENKSYHHDKSVAEKISLARINSIKDTWNPDADYENILNKVYNLSNKTEKKQIDFTFVVNDKLIYYTISDFKSKEAKQYFSEAENLRKTLDETNNSIEQYRIEWVKANNTYKNRNRETILSLERKSKQMSKQIDLLEKRSREAELKLLKNNK